MSIDKNSFDDLVRKKFEGDEEPVESFLWEEVEKQLPVNNAKKRFGYRRLVALLLLVCIPAFIMYLYYGSNKGESKSDTLSNSEVVNSSAITKNPTNELENKTTVIEDVFENNFVKKETTKINSSSVKKTVRLITPEGKQPKNALSTEVVATTPNFELLTQQAQNVVDEPVNGIVSENSVETQISNTPIPTVLEQNAISSSNEIAVVQNDSLTNATKAEPTKTDSLVPQKIKASNWFVEIFYAPEYAKKTFEQNSSDANYLKLRNNSEQFIYAHSYGIRAGKKVAKNMSIKTGLDVTQMQYQLTYGYFPGQAPLPAGIKIDSINGIVIDPLNNGIVTSKDTIVANYELVGQTSEINQYRIYNIPLIFSYAIGTKKMKLETSTGGFVNIVSKQKGSIIGDDRISRINLEEDKQRTPYKTTVGGGICAEVLMTYSIRPQLKFIIGPHAKYYLGKLNKSNAPLNEKLFTTGLLTGFRFDF